MSSIIKEVIAIKEIIDKSNAINRYIKCTNDGTIIDIDSSSSSNKDKTIIDENQIQELIERFEDGDD